MRCCSQWRHSAEKVGVETKMCLFMPTGVLTLLRAAFAFCQERELKGHSQDVETSTPFCLSSIFCLALPPPLRLLRLSGSSFNSYRRSRLPTEE